MKQCLTCGRHHDESEKFCDQDGAPLVELETVAGRGGKDSRWAVGAAALIAGAAVFTVALLAYLYSSGGREARPRPPEAPGRWPRLRRPPRPPRRRNNLRRLRPPRPRPRRPPHPSRPSPR